MNRCLIFHTFNLHRIEIVPNYQATDPKVLLTRITLLCKCLLWKIAKPLKSMNKICFMTFEIYASVHFNEPSTFERNHYDDDDVPFISYTLFPFSHAVISKIQNRNNNRNYDNFSLKIVVVASVSGDGCK